MHTYAHTYTQTPASARREEAAKERVAVEKAQRDVRAMH